MCLALKPVILGRGLSAQALPAGQAEADRPRPSVVLAYKGKKNPARMRDYTRCKFQS